MKSNRSASMTRNTARLWVGEMVHVVQLLNSDKAKRVRRKPSVKRYIPARWTKKIQAKRTVPLENISLDFIDVNLKDCAPDIGAFTGKLELQVANTTTASDISGPDLRPVTDLYVSFGDQDNGLELQVYK
jgi:hypothetical protein